MDIEEEDNPYYCERRKAYGGKGRMRERSGNSTAMRGEKERKLSSGEERQSESILR